jgi:hypothetical protein
VSYILFISKGVRQMTEIEIRSETLTTTLRNGVVVLAKLYKGVPMAMTYANRTQAERAATKANGWVWQGTGRPFYVRFN